MFTAKIKLSALGACALALSAGPAVAQQRPDYGTPVTIEQAKKIAAGVIAECTSNKWNVAVAVVDTHGGLVYYERMENTQTASYDIAIGKARAAATYRRPTRAFVDAIAKSGPAVMTLPGVVASPGVKARTSFSTAPERLAIASASGIACSAKSVPSSGTTIVSSCVLARSECTRA